MLTLESVQLQEFWEKQRTYNPSDIVNSYDYTSGLQAQTNWGHQHLRLSSEIYGGYVSSFLLVLFVEMPIQGYLEAET